MHGRLAPALRALVAVAGVADRFADGLKAAFPALQVIHAGQLDLDQAGGLKHEAGAK